MNLAILIGVSEYDTQNSLLACKSDVELIERLLQATNKYQDILTISSNLKAAQMKNKLSTWVDSYQGQPVEELFFYFTGHGDFYKDEFYFILSDYDERRRQQTSLSNLEVDTWLRSLRPDLAIKVIDACRSGITYVKDGGQTLEKYLQSSKHEYRKAYFMFSSRQDQSSYQDNQLSFFTKSFVSSVMNHEAENIRFRDVIDYISDEFDRENKDDQTPFFVTQADLTEIFCTITSDLKLSIQQQLSVLTPLNNSLVQGQEPISSLVSLKQLVEADAKNYASEEEVVNLLVEIKAQLQKYEGSDEFKDLYQFDLTFIDSYEAVPKLEVLGKWLQENPDKYFAKPTYKLENYEAQEMVPDVENWVKTFGRAKVEYRTVTKKRRIVTGIQPTVDLPFNGITIYPKPLFPNLKWYLCNIVFLISKTHIRFFYQFTNYTEKGWTDKELNTDFKWTQTEEISIKKIDVIQNIMIKILDKFAEHILIEVRQAFIKDSPQE